MEPHEAISVLRKLWLFWRRNGFRLWFMIYIFVVCPKLFNYSLIDLNLVLKGCPFFREQFGSPLFPIGFLFSPEASPRLPALFNTSISVPHDKMPELLVICIHELQLAKSAQFTNISASKLFVACIGLWFTPVASQARLLSFCPLEMK